MMRISRRAKSIAGIAVGAALALSLAACSTGPEADLADTTDDPVLAQLIEDAQAEGSVVWYSAVPRAGSENAAAEFEAKYGIKVELLSLASSALMQRFSAEAEADAMNADVVVGTNFDSTVTNEFIPNGWLEPIDASELPAIENGDFPAEFVNESTATISFIPWVIAYNSDLLDEDDVPTSFEEFADPKYSGMILSSDPGASIAYIEFWDRIQSEFGAETLQGIADNKPRYFDSAAPAAEALAAGEGALVGPTSIPAITPVMEAGAPVDYVTTEVTTGAKMQLALVQRDKAAHPNAARLLAHFLTSSEGNAAIAEPGGDVWVLDPSLDAAYISGLSPAPDAGDRKEEILKNLGRN